MNKKEIIKEVRSIMDEYKERRLSLDKLYDDKLRAIAVPYAKSIARFKVGDIIQCNKLIMRVDAIGAKISRIGEDDIYTVYKGASLTRQYKVRKDNPRDGVELHDNGNFEIKLLKSNQI